MKNFLLLISLLAVNYSFAQDTLIVFFKDKANSNYIEVSDKSMQRRVKNNVEIDSRDKNVSPTYISEMDAVGRVMNVSRWLNGVTMTTDMDPEVMMSTYDFIKSVRVSKSITPVKHKKELLDDEAKADYGPAQHQIEQINLDCLHDLGYDGDGIYVAVIDAGFRGMDTISYFDSAFVEGRILDTYDFLDGDTDVYQHSSHGTSVSSCIFAESSGSNPISATAVEVDVALYVSENPFSETIAEEFDLVAALERADSVGADIATISLGYTNFDNWQDNHSYADMDGETTIAAIGVNAAASKGILVMVAAGNDGPNTISTPCDADSCLCVGAMDDNGWYADFSSIGPSSDNQVKPDIIARGEDATVVSDNGNITTANGTSFATPIMAGAMACLMQANPQSTLDELMFAIRRSGNSYNNPNIYTGYGRPDLCEANDTLYQLSIVGLETNDFNNIELYPNPTNGIIVVKGFNQAENISFCLTNMLGEMAEITSVQYVNKQFIIELDGLSDGIYILEIMDSGSRIASKRLIKY